MWISGNKLTQNNYVYCSLKKEIGYIVKHNFKASYRKYGPAVFHSLIYKKLKPYRTGIERTFALVKENCIYWYIIFTYTEVNNGI